MTTTKIAAVWNEPTYAVLLAAYQAAGNQLTDEVCASVGRNAASCRAKLSACGGYVKPEGKAKVASKAKVSKAELAEKLVEAVGLVDEGAAVALAKLTAQILVNLLAFAEAKNNAAFTAK